MSKELPNPYQTPTRVDDVIQTGNFLLDGQLRTAGFGLRLIYWGIVLMVLGIILVLPAVMFDANLIPAVWAMVGVLILGFLLINVGPLLCVTVPSGTGLRPWAIVTVLTQGLVLAGVFLQGFLIGFPFFSGVWLFLVLGGTVFLAFLDRVSRAISRPDLVRRCRRVFLFGVFLVAVCVLLVALRISFAAVIPYFGLFLIAIGVAVLILVVSYANLINAVSKGILNPPKTAEPNVVP